MCGPHPLYAQVQGFLVPMLSRDGTERLNHTAQLKEVIVHVAAGGQAVDVLISAEGPLTVKVGCCSVDPKPLWTLTPGGP